MLLHSLIYSTKEREKEKWRVRWKKMSGCGSVKSVGGGGKYGIESK